MTFDRVVCGVDRSEASLEAARQAARLAAPDGTLLLLAVAELGLAVHGGWAATTIAADLRADAEAALEAARRELEPARETAVQLVEGGLWPAFRAALERERATLACAGSHGRSRVGGIALGSLPTTLLHEAPCSVLVARASRHGGAFPAAVLVGVDGSPQARAAADVAASLSERFGASLRVVCATGGKHVHADEVGAAHAAVELVAEKPVAALTAAAQDADLLVVGSRGLHGPRALGSVSERVAHESACSVLLVR